MLQKLQKFANELAVAKNQNTQLKFKFDYQVKKPAMKKEKRDCYAIKAGMLELFSEDDLVYGVLSKQGLRNSVIARKQLDEEKLGKIEGVAK
ncbi:hypothetical protein BV898_10034 [Hypsibius exemplaris]|uniref:Uncharacterized protein n=1 Tax=Hypsibius exemplaris TaxID=2072580 RepID=A0A1W0WKN8_HYPEX|nr:hypothetical protein BV898_10034 [Hypsibius exemplaris]